MEYMFSRFGREKLVPENRECFERPTMFDDYQIETLVKNNPGSTTRGIAEILLTSLMDNYYLKRLGCVWISHDLTEKNSMNRIFTCDVFAQTQQKQLI